MTHRHISPPSSAAGIIIVAGLILALGLFLPLAIYGGYHLPPHLLRFRLAMRSKRKRLME